MLGKGLMQHRPYKQIYSMDTPNYAHVTTQYLWKYSDGKSGYFKIHGTITVC